MKNNQVSLGKGESFGFPFFLSVSRGSGSGSQTLKTRGSQAHSCFPKISKGRKTGEAMTPKSSQASLFGVPHYCKLADIRQLNHEPKNLVALDQEQWNSQQDIRQIKMHWRKRDH